MKQTIKFTLLIALMMIISACSKTIELRKSKVVPAAEVNLKIQQDDNGNYQLDIKVENMAQPEDLTPAQKFYVAWIETDAGTYNLGRVSINKNLKGRLTSTTPYEPKKFMITAEDEFKINVTHTHFIVFSETL